MLEWFALNYIIPKSHQLHTVDMLGTKYFKVVLNIIRSELFAGWISLSDPGHSEYSDDLKLANDMPLNFRMVNGLFNGAKYLYIVIFVEHVRLSVL